MQVAGLLDEFLSKLGALAMQPQVAAVDNPAGAGLDAPGTGAGDGVVNRKTTQIQATATVAGQWTGDKWVFDPEI